MLSAKLVVVGGEVKTTEIKLRLPAVIGRGKGSTITLLQPLVSRQHCELFEANGKLWVRDLGSLNGTYVNNEKVTESELPPNELLTVGTVTFRAVYEPLDDQGSSSDSAPQFLPGKSQEDDDQPTVRVDAPRSADELAANEEIEEISHFEQDEGLPSTPLFESDTTKEPPRSAPAAPRQASAAPARPAVPSAVTTDVPVPKPTPAPKPAPAAKQPAKEEPAEEEDDDLNDFLKSLGKK